MPTPESGVTTVDTSANLGDVGKLDFLDKLDDSGNIVTDDGQPALDERDPSEILDDKPQVDEDPDPVVPVTRVTDQGVITPSKKARDYTGIPEDLVPIFKGMSNDAFSKAQEWYKKSTVDDTKYKGLEDNYNKIKDLQYYQHPDAYRLSDGYNGLVKQYQTNNTKANYWRQALIALNKGQPIKDLLLDKDGNIAGVAEVELQPSEELKLQVQEALTQSQFAAQSLIGKIDAHKSDYANRHKEFDNSLVQLETNLLGEMRKHEKFKAIEQSMLGLVPPELRGSRQYQLIAGMGAYIKALILENQRINGLVKGKKTVRQTMQSAGPGDGQGANGSEENTNPQQFIQELKKYRGMA